MTSMKEITFRPGQSPEAENPRELAVKKEAPFDDDEIEGSEEMRQRQARDLGLSPDASWVEIAEKSDEANHGGSARALGLPETATWEEINAAVGGEGDRISQALLLGLGRD